MLVYHILYIHVKTIKHVGLVQNRYYYHLIEYNLFSPWYSWKNCSFVNTQQSFTHSV